MRCRSFALSLAPPLRAQLSGESAPLGARRRNIEMSLNVVHLIGNLGQDPELRTSEGGIAVTNLSVATNEVYKDQNGERQQRTEWHRVVIWGRQAETSAKFLSKGRRVQ